MRRGGWWLGAHEGEDVVGGGAGAGAGGGGGGDWVGVVGGCVGWAGSLNSLYVHR